MIDRIKILGYTIAADFDTHTLTAIPYETNKTISQYEEVILEISTQGIDNPKSVRANFTLNDGTVINNIYLAPVIGYVNKFRVRLNEVIGNKLKVGENQTVNITLRLSTDTSFAVLEDTPLSYQLYRTTLDTTYHPTDMDTVFVSLNKLNQEISDVDSRKLDSSGGTVVGDFTITGKTTLLDADIKSGNISNVNIIDSTMSNMKVPSKTTITVNGEIDNVNGFISVPNPRADKPNDASNKSYVDTTVKSSIDSNNIQIRNDITGYETDTSDNITLYGNRKYTTESINTIKSNAIKSVELKTIQSTGEYVLTFTKINGEKLNPIVIDTPDEKIISNAYMEGNNLVLEFVGDVEPVKVNMSQFITIYSGTESPTISLTVDASKKTITADIKDGSITTNKLSTELQNIVRDIPNAESTRQSNEEIRKSNELERQSNEETRILNENTRIANENERIDKFTEWENTLSTYATKTEVNTALETKADKTELFSGKYSDLTGKPTIPTAVSQLTNDSRYVSETGLKTINGNTITGSGDIEIHGTNVEGNPSGDATVELSKLTINDTVYSVVDSNFVNSKIADLIGTAPDTLDTLGELAKAFTDNKDVVDALQTSIADKADKSSVYTKQEVDNKLANIGDIDLQNYYNKSQINTKLDSKANTSDVYTQTVIDNKLDMKANSNDVYTKSQTYDREEIETLVATKSGIFNTLSGYGITDAYTKTEITNLLSTKANTSAIPTKTSQLQNDSGYITEADIPTMDGQVIFREWTTEAV